MNQRNDTNSMPVSSRVEEVAHRLIHRAALRAPASLSERLQEEWLADLAARPSPVSRLRFAVGCCWATRIIAHEYGASSIPVTKPAVGGKLVMAYLHGDFGAFSRRSSTFLLVLCLHIAVFYGLMMGLASKINKAIPSPLQNQSLPEQRSRELPPALPRPPLTTQKIEVPIPEFTAPQELNESVEVLAQPPGPLLPLPPSITPHVGNRVQGGPGIGFPNSDDYYPSAAKRLGEQGVTTVGVCVDAIGRLTADPRTVQSSGSQRLDDGALQLAKAGSGHYRASTEDGNRVNSCYSFRVRFELRK